jgi:hypothetical protein
MARGDGEDGGGRGWRRGVRADLEEAACTEVANELREGEGAQRPAGEQQVPHAAPRRDARHGERAGWAERGEAAGEGAGAARGRGGACGWVGGGHGA